MSQAIIADLMNRILGCVGQSMTKDTARQLVKLRLDKRCQTYVDSLADKANEGQLSPSELNEYRSLVNVFDRVAVLQSKARQYLAKRRRSSVAS